MPKVSILLVTYNHAAYISAALDSVIAQKYRGQIEIVVADDASTDQTLDVIRSYDGRDSRLLFKYLPADTNLGITRNYQRGFAACAGEYVAVLEGDDYWPSPGKLAQQAKLLDQNPGYKLCSVNYFCLDETTGESTIRTPQGVGYRTITAHDLIADNLVGNFSTCMYRKSALDALPAELFVAQSYDWIVNICVAADSPIAFIEEPMSVYRLHSGSAWSQKKSIDKIKSQLGLIPQYDAITKGRFRAAFTELETTLKRRIRIAESCEMVDHPPIHLSRSDKSLLFLIEESRAAAERGDQRAVSDLHEQIDQYRAVLDMP